MQVSVPTTEVPGERRFKVNFSGWTLLAGLSLLLAFSVFSQLWVSWRGDSSLSHGPLIPIKTGALLWSKRERLRDWRGASPAGLALLVFCALLHVAGVWADVEYIKPLSF